MTATSSAIDGAELVRRFLPESPFVAHTGIRLDELSDGRAVLRLPFREEVATIGTVVHGGAIATLIDTAAMAAAWSGADVPETLRGATVSLAVSYLAPAEDDDLVATATVLRRGRRLTTIRVDIHADAGRHVATAVVVYQLG